MRRSYGIIPLDPTSKGNNVAIVRMKLNYELSMLIQFAECKELPRWKRVSSIMRVMHLMSIPEREKLMESPEEALFPLYGPKRVFKVLDVIKEALGRFRENKNSSKSSTVGTWSIPKGKAFRGESGLKAALREMIEETGYDMNDFRILSPEPITIQYTDRYDQKYELILYIAMMERSFEDKYVGNENIEISHVKWVKQDELTCYLPMEYGRLLRSRLYERLMRV